MNNYMNESKKISCDTVIAGGGIAGLVCALELLEAGQKVIIIDRDTQDRLGGLARWAFGGMALSETQQQKRMKVPDSPALLLKDWQSFAEFEAEDYWPKQWAQTYAENNNEMVYQWLLKLGLKFMPAVNWVERGLFTPGNSVPRYHILWGTGLHLVETIIAKLTPYLIPSHSAFSGNKASLKIYHQHKVIKPISEQQSNIVIACGVEVLNELKMEHFSIESKHVVIACGGINGSIDRVKDNWFPSLDKAPKALLNGANPISDGLLHDELVQIGGQVTHSDKMWNYAAGIHHPQAEFDGHGLSLIPCKSALWMDHTGKRIGPIPLVTGFDTHYLCHQVAKQEQPWTWHILNWDIAAKELAVSGSLHNPSIVNRNFLSFIKETLLGNHRLIRQLEEESDDFLCADSLSELVDKMNTLVGKEYVDYQVIKNQIEQYDEQLTWGEHLQNDDQLRRINHARQWKIDKLRTCKPKPILTKRGKNKLIAIRVQLISRKSLGGIQTNLKSEVLDNNAKAIPGLYCIGEAAGFGGGGASGLRSLEGTFLSGCILTARKAAQAIIEQQK
ncbi:FAD-dependent oxidoreductase [Thalassotalea profundi]|uniref:Fumarate reductase/succinate dehydrogenase n=1 Tax=Thalassotalea profundi TaxID=2036687 RepID=A0ABQ3IXW2_9GAMM|nr:FAD-dependent oxidoreductase [Thalassotalea profundi]GHE97848.1 putative fumarate reductase/succinate dehydrogenase [Thalassotalea profundi]